MGNHFQELVAKAKAQSLRLASSSEDFRNSVLLSLVKNIKEYKEDIQKANQKDQEICKNLVQQKKLKESLFHRVCLDHKKIASLSEYPKKISQLTDPIQKIQYQCELDKGLNLKRYSTPLGVLLVIFESRPEVLIQIGSLAIKSGNGVLLKGGSEAKHTNQVLFRILNASLQQHKLEGLVSLLETRSEITQLLKEEGIDLIIPRGSNELVRFIQENTKTPVMGHADGICHVYLDEKADQNKARAITIDSKCEYPAVCNASETLLVHKNLNKDFVSKLFQELSQNGVELRLAKELEPLAKQNQLPYKLATEQDWQTEYTEKILSIKEVASVEEAVAHINFYGSHHTDSIVTEDKKIADYFLWNVDSAGVFHNASTRFADGQVYGLGAEVGVSTNKLHARGPVGLEGLMTYKYILEGEGQTKADYSNKPFLHQK